MWSNISNFLAIYSLSLLWTRPLHQRRSSPSWSLPTSWPLQPPAPPAVFLVSVSDSLSFFPPLFYQTLQLNLFYTCSDLTRHTRLLSAVCASSFTFLLLFWNHRTANCIALLVGEDQVFLFTGRKEKTEMATFMQNTDFNPVKSVVTLGQIITLT